MRLVKLPAKFGNLQSFCFSLISVFSEVFLKMSQPPRKAKQVFRGQLTQFKFEELIDVKEIGMYTF